MVTGIPSHPSEARLISVTNHTILVENKTSEWGLRRWGCLCLVEEIAREMTVMDDSISGLPYAKHCSVLYNVTSLN